MGNLGTAATAKKDPVSAPSETWPPECVQLFSMWMSTCIRGCMSVWKTARLQACACVSLFYKPDISFFFLLFCFVGDSVGVRAPLFWGASQKRQNFNADRQITRRPSFMRVMARGGGAELVCIYRTRSCLPMDARSLLGQFTPLSKPGTNHYIPKHSDDRQTRSPSQPSSLVLLLVPLDDQVDPLQNQQHVLRIITLVSREDY